jgi:hypothetical protein
VEVPVKVLARPSHGKHCLECSRAEGSVAFQTPKVQAERQQEEQANHAKKEKNNVKEA